MMDTRKYAQLLVLMNRLLDIVYFIDRFIRTVHPFQTSYTVAGYINCIFHFSAFVFISTAEAGLKLLQRLCVYIQLVVYTITYFKKAGIYTLILVFPSAECLCEMYKSTTYTLLL